MTPGVGRLSPLQLQIEKLCSEGLTYAQIGEKLGLKVASVGRHLEKIRGIRDFEKLTGRPAAPLKRVTAETVQELVRQGLNHRTIAERFGVSLSHIDRVMMQARRGA